MIYIQIFKKIFYIISSLYSLILLLIGSFSNIQLNYTSFLKLYILIYMLLSIFKPFIDKKRVFYYLWIIINILIISTPTISYILVFPELTIDDFFPFIVFQMTMFITPISLYFFLDILLKTKYHKLK